jgi:hypothetical protein
VLTIDLTAAARSADPERARDWLGAQRVFISSAMADTANERRAVAAAIEDEGARAVWFEEFGRDADAEEAYLTEVDSSTTYVAILNQIYGRQNAATGYSATEAEYHRAREGGKRVVIFVAEDGSAREGHLTHFINDRLRVFLTTENYPDTEDLVRRVRRRLHDLAAEALSPWVKLGDLIFRADEIVEDATTAVIKFQTNEDIAYRIGALRDQQYGRRQLRLTYETRVIDGELSDVRRTVRAGGRSEMQVTLSRLQLPGGNQMRAGTTGYSADELTEFGLKHQLFQEPLPDHLAMMGLTATGVEDDDLRQCFESPNEVAEAITRLVLADGLVGGGRTSRITRCQLGPRTQGSRRLLLEWEDPNVYRDQPPNRRAITGDWLPGEVAPPNGRQAWQ